jgi:hypothetical protein
LLNVQVSGKLTRADYEDFDHDASADARAWLDEL